MSKLFLFTLTWNAQDKLTKLKESLLPALQGLDYTWVIKDNASHDQTVEVASTWGSNVKVLPYKNNNQNFSQGMNYCFGEASPQDDDLVLLLNNDVIVNDTTSIKNMLNLLAADSEIGAIGARLLYTNTTRLQHAGVIFNSRYGGPDHFRLNEESDKEAEKNRYFQVVTGAVLLTKAKYFKNVCETNKSGIKGMDENFHWAFDDVDLCLSIKYRMNKKIVYCGKTSFFHEESASLKKNPANKLFMAHNKNLLNSKWDKEYAYDLEDYSRNTKHNLYKK